MWFSREQFRVCNELKSWGLQPRFEIGDVVARGFADLGFEEFQVLPGSKVLSLTAGTSTPFPSDHLHHFFWIPSVDECIDLLEQAGAQCITSERIEQRQWRVEVQVGDYVSVCNDQSLHLALLLVLQSVYRERYKAAS
jgi:hypothetical protein